MRASQEIKTGEVLVFGHAHVPSVNKAENVVNFGSWVKDANPYDTYVELTDGKRYPLIFGHRKQEITERTER